MKKTYKVPSLMEVKIQSTRIIAASQVGFGEEITDAGAPVVEGDVKGITTKNIWDDQW